jgi:serine/threonine-protein kinase HipA
MSSAAVRLWGRRIAAVTWVEEEGLGYFEYVPDFVRSGIQVAPLTMPLARQVYRFAQLRRDSFHGLPGLLADSLPDDFGNALIDAWLASQGRAAGSLNPVERLCYTGRRGMGALEFEPVLGENPPRAERVELEELVQLASRVLQDREAFCASLDDASGTHTMQQILQVGTSAGGARAKAVLAWNPQTGELRSGQAELGAGFEDWVLKFDGVSGNGEHGIADPQGYGRIEFAYHLMARASGIEMSDCRLFEEGGRAHFMTRRFDRDAQGKKLHMQTLCAMAHLDFRLAGAHGYEQALEVLEQLELKMSAKEELFRRMVFNVLARNQDDHSKNLAFLMNQRGQWRLAPAYDVIYAYNPSGAWTGQHQMSIGGKRDGFVREDFVNFGKRARFKRGRAATLLDEVGAAVSRWPEFAETAGVPEERMEAIRANSSTAC